MTIQTEQINLWHEKKNGQNIVHVVLNVNSVTPTCLGELAKQNIFGLIPQKEGVILDNARPTWLAGFLVHQFHPALWVALNDPRLGAVVVESHSINVSVGDLIQWQ